MVTWASHYFKEHSALVQKGLGKWVSQLHDAMKKRQTRGGRKIPSSVSVDSDRVDKQPQSRSRSIRP